MAKKRCKCAWCKRYGQYKKVMASRSIKELREFTTKLFDLYCQTASDLNYNEAILDGSWPTAVELLERSLEKAKAMEVGETDQEQTDGGQVTRSGLTT